jgi:hypothetical protein
LIELLKKALPDCAEADDFVAVKERMASFMAAGFIELCRGGSE